MIGLLYYILLNIELTALLLVVVHYIYLEPFFVLKRNCYILFTVYLISIMLLYTLMRSGWIGDGSFLPVLFCGIYILCIRKEHKIRGLFLPIPILGLCIGMLMPFFIIPDLFISRQQINLFINYCADAIVVVFLVLFAVKGKKWRENFAIEVQHRRLELWERRLLNASGVFLFFLLILLLFLFVEEDKMKEIPFYIRLIIALFSFLSMYLTFVVLALILQGNKRNYYKNTASLNEHYLQVQFNHFKAYRETQKETRRIRHDMKNHLHCLHHLAEKGDLNEIMAYINEMDNEISRIDTILHSGNEMADLICSEKNILARKYGITIHITGVLPSEGFLAPIDVCTIFSNALDNAIEETKNRDQRNRWISIDISGQGKMIVLQFKNPMDPRKNISPLGITTKKDPENHGFGLQNIQTAVKKYQGDLSIYPEEQDGGKVYVLKVCLVLNERR